MYERQTTHKDMIEAMRKCFSPYSDAQEEIRHYGIKRFFPNGMRCDLIFYKKSLNILRFNRGAWMVRENPVLGGLFDEVNKVIAKMQLVTPDDIENKAIPELIALIAKAPSGIKYNAGFPNM